MTSKYGNRFIIRFQIYLQRMGRDVNREVGCEVKEQETTGRDDNATMTLLGLRGVAKLAR